MKCDARYCPISDLFIFSGSLQQDVHCKVELLPKLVDILFHEGEGHNLRHESDSSALMTTTHQTQRKIKEG